MFPRHAPFSSAPSWHRAKNIPAFPSYVKANFFADLPLEAVPKLAHWRPLTVWNPSDFPTCPFFMGFGQFGGRLWGIIYPAWGIGC
jgi:hypothetical protein